MKPVTSIVVLLALGIVLGLSAAWSQMDMTVVDNTIFETPRRPPAVFHHDEHNDQAFLFDCAVCHHVYENGERVEGASSEDQRCSDCHDLKGSQGRPSLIQAFHGQCKGCHLEQGQGPIMCGECHVKPRSRP